MMRARTLVTALLVLAPTALSAQLIPVRIGRRGPAQPQPLPPQPTPVALQLAYTRSHLSFESYPMVSFTSVPGFAPGRAGSWASVGVGTHADYRIARFISATMDLTSSLYGGPALTQTAEVGARFNRARGGGRWYPYFDLRAGYIATYLNYGASYGDVYVDPSVRAYSDRYSHGFGAIAGAGFEYALTNAMSLMTGASLLRGGLTQHSLESFSATDQHFTITSLRYTLGLRFNPVYAVHPGRTDQKTTNR